MQSESSPDVETLRRRLQAVTDERDRLYRFTVARLQLELDELREENRRIDGLIQAIHASRQRVVNGRAKPLVDGLRAVRNRLRKR